MIVVGDIHGNFKDYLSLLKRYGSQSSVQVGDFGWGFGPVPELPANAWFFRGNHDHPELARSSKHYLGDYGQKEIDGVNFFFVSGAWSIDKNMRIEGRDWWPDEELSIAELNAALELYIQTKPDIVITHDGPNIATNEILNKYSIQKLDPIPTRTSQALNAMYEAHQPKKWIFGHWHTTWRKTIGKTDFRCLAELGWCEINEK